ncbi:serine/threonine-protein phosphatase 6 regulatory ankyrin repeat subunit A-like [Copidosoma floridanum]|uniref:serine/threonine-protein phosphatase 6 regulatory ankyrin repeat subunit A-like n=1 Tax=Copidosoma floridanum TaxID=29053 RepID=UPI0006C972BA|nr:serine/threonine-protein phosphatase 6 regulatory ankyrin repeat subunit A-like [Copidosoma floridanum]XP_014215042.1 serine/threonine-protein phosphatase 6 regulatory ankyrin repeat subunit A-like [Copidosoma floridanum]
MLPAVCMDQNYKKLIEIQRTLKSASKHEIEAILDSGFDINYAMPQNSKNNLAGCTALHLAVNNFSNNQQSEIIDLLLSKGADFTLKNSEGFTPLLIIYNFLSGTLSGMVITTNLIKQLLFAHIKYHNPSNPCSNEGISHLHVACKSDNVEVTKFFLCSGVSVNQSISNNSKTLAGCTCLHLAIYNGNKQMVELLIHYGAELCPNTDGKNPLHLIIEKQMNDALVYISPAQPDKELIKNENILNLLLVPNADNLNPTDGFGLSHFHVRCIKKIQNELQMLETLIDNGVNINAALSFDSPSCPGYTPLHFAAKCNFETLMLLLKKGANLMAKDKHGVTPLDVCTTRCNPSQVSQILKTQESLKSIKLENGTLLIDVIAEFSTEEKLHDYLKINDVNARIPFDSILWPGCTLFHLAVILSSSRDTFKIKVCLRHGVDVTIQDANQRTALHLAFHLQKSASFILYAHASTLVDLIDKDGLSHFHIACIFNNVKIAEKFLVNGVNPNTVIKANIDNVKGYWYDNHFKDSTVINGSTPLHIAVFVESKALAKLLLKHHANPLLTNAYGLTWMHIAFLSNQDFSFRDLYFKSCAGATQANPVAPGQLSHFHIACHSKHLKAVQALLPIVNDINEPINGKLMDYIKKLPHNVCLGDTPLHLAVGNHSAEIVDLLLENGADVTLKNANGLKPLHIALQNYSRVRSQNAIIRRLFEFEKQVDWPDSIGLTELHIACALEDESMMETLLKSGKNPNSPVKVDSHVWPGWTPLHVLVEAGYPKKDNTVKLLLKYILQSYESAVLGSQPLHGSPKRQKIISLHKDELLVNLRGLSVFHVSCMTGDIAIVEKFISLGVDINEPTDGYYAGDFDFTPLLFALKYNRKNVVELLLDLGVDIYTKDLYGYSALRVAALNSPDLLNLLLSKGKDFEIESSNDEYDEPSATIFDWLIENNKATCSHFLKIMSHKSRMESLRVTTKMNLATQLAFNFPASDFETLIQHIPNLTDLDDDGRNVIYHIVSSSQFQDMKSSYFDEFRTKIDLLESIGCDIDHQDSEGQTLLHCLVNESPQRTIEFLLSIGADINIVDNNDETAATLALECYDFNAFSEYIDRLTTAGLHVDPLNGDLGTEKPSFTLKLSNELETMKNFTIIDSFSLRDVLTENMVRKFAKMPGRQRRAILEYIQDSDLRQKYPGWLPVFKFQRRRALKMEKLYESAFISLQDLLDSRLPELCIKPIMIYLAEKDWRNLTLVKK